LIFKYLKNINKEKGFIKKEIVLSTFNYYPKKDIANSPAAKAKTMKIFMILKCLFTCLKCDGFDGKMAEYLYKNFWKEFFDYVTLTGRIHNK